MRISVIIPCFNEEKRIEECLRSIFNQSEAPFEVIVIDNNSTDRTREIATKLGAKVISQSRQGLSFARNAGFNFASGDILLKTDGDTKVPSNWIRVMREHFSDQKVGRVTGSAVFYSRLFNPLFNFLMFWVNDIFGYKALLGPNYAIRRDIWEKIKDEIHIEDAKFHEDLDIAIHSAKYGKYVRDMNLKVSTSHRRVADTKSLFIDYHLKWRHTVFLKDHRKNSRVFLMHMLT